MNLPSCNAKVDYISDLYDKPNTDPTMNATKLKQQFDAAGAEIKSYLNTIVPMINSGTNSFVTTSDSRLTNSRQCNNSFDTPLTARSNLKIKTGTSLPGTVEEDCLFFLYS